MVEERNNLTQPGRAASPDPGRPYLTRIRSEVEELIAAQINRANGCFSSPTDTTDLEHREGEYKIWDDYNLELLRRMFSDNSCAKEYENCLIGSGGFIGEEWPLTIFEEAHNFFRMVTVKKNCLQSIKARLPLIPEAPSIAFQPSGAHMEPTGSKVFLVHGHDDGMKTDVARFLEKQNREVVIFHEHTDEGRTIIEKLEDLSEDIGFAVVLMTPDDVGRGGQRGKITASGSAERDP